MGSQEYLIFMAGIKRLCSSHIPITKVELLNPRNSVQLNGTRLTNDITPHGCHLSWPLIAPSLVLRSIGPLTFITRLNKHTGAVFMAADQPTRHPQSNSHCRQCLCHHLSPFHPVYPPNSFHTSSSRHVRPLLSFVGHERPSYLL